MVYIYKKTSGDRNYYYLRGSERKGKRVISKDIAYLGSNIEEVKKNLAKLDKYKDEIRKAYRTIHLFLESNYYLEKTKSLKLKNDSFLEKKINDIEACKLHYNSVFLKSSQETKKETWKNFIVEFSFNTTSIEGNTINLAEAKNLLERGLTPKDKTLREIYDLQNTERTFLLLLENKKKLSHELIIKIHSMLMENIDARKGYRTSDVRVIHSNFDATPAPYVKIDMGLILKWYEENKEKLHPLILAIVFHHKFEKVHPFMDGNGRTGRMLLNCILMLYSYPPIIIHKKARKEYLEALRDADKNDLNSMDKETYFNLINFNTSEFIEDYWNIFL